MISEYLTFVDILITLLWLGILSIIVNNQASKLENQEIKPYYVRNFYIKVFYGNSISQNSDKFAKRQLVINKINLIIKK